MIGREAVGALRNRTNPEPRYPARVQGEAERYINGEREAAAAAIKAI